jgi:uncharacterized protein (TIRG00374 family)
LKKGRILNILISTVILALFLYLAFRNVNLSELVQILESTNYLYVFIGGLVGVVGGSLVRSYRWKFLLAPIKKDTKFGNLFSTTVIGYMVNNLIPRSGEVVRPVLFGKREGISRAAAFGTIIVERIIDTVMFLLMFGVCLIFFKNRITDAFPEMNTAVIILSGLSFILTIWVLFTMFKTDLSLKILKIFLKIFPASIQDKIDKIFVSLVFGFESLKKPGLLLKITFYSIILWLVYLLGTLIPFYSFGILSGGNFSLWETIWDGNLLLVLISVSMFVPSPAATGPYHYIVKVTLTVIFSIENAKALGYATSTHAMGFLIYLVLGLYYFIVSNYKISELKEKTA